MDKALNKDEGAGVDWGLIDATGGLASGGAIFFEDASEVGNSEEAGAGFSGLAVVEDFTRNKTDKRFNFFPVC